MVPILPKMALSLSFQSHLNNSHLNNLPAFSKHNGIKNRCEKNFPWKFVESTAHEAPFPAVYGHAGLLPRPRKIFCSQDKLLKCCFKKQFLLSASELVRFNGEWLRLRDQGEPIVFYHYPRSKLEEKWFTTWYSKVSHVVDIQEFDWL